MSAGTTMAPRAGLRRRVLPAALLSLAGVAGWLVPASQAALAASQGLISISAGYAHSCALEDGRAYCWGDNGYGQLGDGTTNNSSIPVAVDTRGALAGKILTQITAGYADTCALDSAGAAYCWGYNASGQLGDGTTNSSSIPVAVDAYGALAGQTLTQITVGYFHACALDASGAAYCWGYNGDGELGDGGGGNSSVPVAVTTSGVLAGKTLTQISAGPIADHTCALDASGAAYCWGRNVLGELGDGSTTDGYFPVAVDTSGVLAGKILTQVTAADSHTCALGASGAVYCWGYNYDGELGNGSTADSSVAVAVDTTGVLAGKTLTRITAGDLHTCALDSTGEAYCWGGNYYGELGDGGITSSAVAVAVDTTGVLAGKTLTRITAGGNDTCAGDAAGAFYCWGRNDAGQLGDNTTTSSDVAVLAGPQAPASVTAIPGDTTATVSWAAPASLDGAALAGYTATASPGGAACTTTGATTCVITGLANGTTYSITVVAHTTAGDSGASTPVAVTPTGGPAFTSSPADTQPFGVAFRFTVTTTGSPAPTITRTGPLPPGVTFADNRDGTATIAGTPAHAAAGVYPLTLTASNSEGTATQTFRLTITRAPAIRNIPATTAKVGHPLRVAITATGYPLPALAETGPLPAGLTFTSNPDGTAAITGTPATGSGGRYPITVTATNPSATTSQTFTLTVRQPPAITSARTATVATGSAFSFQVTATGFPAPKITKTGRLPRGVRFTAATATFHGRPKAATSGRYPITITATSISGTATQHFTLIVSPATRQR